MTLEEGIYGFLSVNGDVKASLGLDSTGAPCIYPVAIAEDAVFPAAAFTRVGGKRGMSLTAPSGPVHVRMQFTTATDGPDPGPSHAAMDVLISILHGFHGALPNGLVVQLCSLVLEPVDTYVNEARMWTRHCDFEFVYEA